MSLIRSSRRWPLRSAMVVSSSTSLSMSPSTPELISCSEPMIEVSGVRSSWLSVEVNSCFMRSASSCWVMSRPCTITESTRFSALTSGVRLHSQVISTPSRARWPRRAGRTAGSRLRIRSPQRSPMLLLSGAGNRVSVPARPISSAAPKPNRVSAAGLALRIGPWASNSNTAIGERSANSASLRPEASTWRRASSSSTSCRSRRWLSAL